MRRWAGAVVACVVALTANTILPAADASAAVERAGAAGSIAWRDCGDGLECARVPVPVDHDAPGGDRFDLAVARVRAADPDDRIGVLVVNPGGPGVSAVDRLPGLAQLLPDEVRNRFDIVSFDSRGVAEGVHVDCDTSLDPVFDASFSPVDDAARAELVAAVGAVADACGRRDGGLLRQVSTVDTARDLDVVRDALGESRLSYLGFSYGTYLGSLYAAQFPDRVRALVLDGAVEPPGDPLEYVLVQARGFEGNLDAFLADCASKPSCAFHRQGDTAAAYDALRARLAARALVVDGAGDHALNDTRFDAAVLQLLYAGRSSWDELARALDRADDGDGRALLAIADRFVGRRAGGDDDDTVEAFWAISCLDGPAVEGVEEMTTIERAVRRDAPRLGGFVVNFSLACAVWPAQPETSPPSIVGAAPDALVVSTTRDPATPLVSARRLARALGDAAMVIVPGDRHTAIGGGSDCVDDAVARYLVGPRRPRDQVTRC
jgi:pimeloyl-ACP methyl ester carboxylesterase